MRAFSPIDDLTSAQLFFATLAGQPREVVSFAFLDPKRRILGCRHDLGGMTQATASIRRVLRDAIAFDAAGLVMAHNHPSGDPTPSVRDIAYSRILARTLDALGIELIDHLILAGDRIVSLRERGIL